MTFSRANPLGWALYEVLTSAQMNALDINASRAIDGFAGGSYSPSDKLTWNEQLVVDAAGSALTDADCIAGTGKGTGTGVKGTGGADNGVGVTGQGTGTGAGVYGISGVGVGPGVYGIASGSSRGVQGISNAGAAIHGSGGTGHGLKGIQTNPTPIKGTLGLDNAALDPSAPDQGDVWVRAGSGFHTQLDGVHQTMTPTWGACTTGGAGPTLLASNNVASLAYNGARLVVNFTHAFAVGGGAYHFCAFVQNIGANGVFDYAVLPQNTPVDSIEIPCWDTAGSAVDLSAITQTVGFLVFGKYV